VKKTFKTLVKAAESISQMELFMAPELTTLAALDATLLATTNLFDLNSFHLSELEGMGNYPPRVAEKCLAESICVLAKALRKNLAAYYATVQESCKEQEATDPLAF